MKIYLFKKENEEEVYYKVDDIDQEYILNFERIKDLSKMILNKKIDGEECDFDVSVQDSSLDIYKTTLDNVFNSIRNDEDLYNLYSESKNDDVKEGNEK